VIRGLAALVAVTAIAAACAGSAIGVIGPTPLTVFAAASLRDAMERVVEAYEAVEAVSIDLATDSSATLRTQIEQGAAVDVFLSADLANPEALVAGGLADGAVVPFAGNSLTIIVPAANPAAIETPADVATPGVKVIAAGEDVPITRYATQAIEGLATIPGYPADFAGAYAANVVSREDNVAAVVTKVALGEGDAAFVYETDAIGADGVRPIALPDVAQVVATYGGVVVAGSDEREAARAFLDWLGGPGGQAVLAEFGFQPAP
jgi:molybdate transport system substrate-binding protein